MKKHSEEFLKKKAEKRAEQLKEIEKYAKENNISISCAEFRLNYLRGDSPTIRRVKELIAQGKGFSSARRQASMEAKGTWTDNK